MLLPVLSSLLLLPLPQDPPPIERAAAAIAPRVAALCGREFRAAVPAASMSTAELRAHAEQRIDRELADGRLERLEAWLHCLRLIGPDQHFRSEATALMVGQAAAIYDTTDKQLYLHADAATADDWYARYTIAHELAHALDDQVLDLQRLLQPADHDLAKDQLFALGAAIEGSAIGVSDLWAAQSPPPADYDPMASEQARATAAEANAAMRKAPPYCTLLIGRHMIGRLFFAAGRKLRGTKDGEYLGLLSLADHLPASTEQILHPEKFWREDRRDEPIVLTAAAEQALATAIGTRTGLRVVGRDTLGELVAALLAAPIDRRFEPAAAGSIRTWTNAAATGWGGDRLFVVGESGGTAGAPVVAPGVIWITAWDTAADCAEFATALQQQRGELPGFAHAVAGRAAAFAFGGAHCDASALQELLTAARFEQDGRDWSP